MSGSGKSTLSRAIFLSAAAPRLVIDPAASELTAIEGAVPFRDPRRIPWDEGATLRFVPRGASDRDVFDELYCQLMVSGRPCFTWLDEPEAAMPATGYVKWGKTLIVRGRKLELGHLANATEPVNILVNLKRNADHIIMFETPLEEDRRELARAMGVERAVVEAMHAQVVAEPFSFAWLNRRARTFTHCPPIALAA